MKYLTQDEIKRLLVPIDSIGDKLLIQLGLVMGCRVSEVVTIRLKNVSADRIKLWDEKKNLFREAVIDSETKALLDEYLRTEWKSEPHVAHQLFYFSTKTANRILKRWCKVAGIPKDKAHYHVLRHSYVIHSLEAGVPINHVCEQTGDSATTIVTEYGKPSIDARKQMLEAKGLYWK